MTVKNVFWAVDWIESERGWGQKYSHTDWFKSEKKAQAAIKKHWDNEEKINPSGETPDWYMRPNVPELRVKK